jgi:hypothetical protein
MEYLRLLTCVSSGGLQSSTPHLYGTYLDYRKLFGNGGSRHDDNVLELVIPAGMIESACLPLLYIYHYDFLSTVNNIGHCGRVLVQLAPNGKRRSGVLRYLGTYLHPSRLPYRYRYVTVITGVPTLPHPLSQPEPAVCNTSSKKQLAHLCPQKASATRPTSKLRVQLKEGATSRSRRNADHFLLSTPIQNPSTD